MAFQSAYCGFNVTVWLRSQGSVERAKPKFERLRTIYLNTFEAMKQTRRHTAADSPPPLT
ncbi:hypothetical protein [Collinsella tanakaei]|uniref:hypothetical protein n=1 Tax=Collinsella tanakaei TaxID=626935 RepID=UPI0031E9B9D0